MTHPPNPTSVCILTGNRAMESAELWKARPKTATFPQLLGNAHRPPPAFPTAPTAPAGENRAVEKETTPRSRVGSPTLNINPSGQLICYETRTT